MLSQNNSQCTVCSCVLCTGHLHVLETDHVFDSVCHEHVVFNGDVTVQHTQHLKYITHNILYRKQLLCFRREQKVMDGF